MLVGSVEAGAAPGGDLEVDPPGTSVRVAGGSVSIGESVHPGMKWPSCGLLSAPFCPKFYTKQGGGLVAHV
jgi:hypothetical protein